MTDNFALRAENALNARHNLVVGFRCFLTAVTHGLSRTKCRLGTDTMLARGAGHLGKRHVRLGCPPDLSDLHLLAEGEPLPRWMPAKI